MKKKIKNKKKKEHENYLGKNKLNLSAYLCVFGGFVRIIFKIQQKNTLPFFFKQVNKRQDIFWIWVLVNL